MSESRLAALVALQDLDTASDQLRHRRQQLPERRKLEDLEASIASSQRELLAVEASLSELVDRQGEAENELAETEKRRASLDRQLYGGSVSASRDLQAMSAEAEHVKERASSLEDRVLALLEERDPLEGSRRGLEAKLADLTSQREVAVRELGDAEAVIDAELSELEARRGDLAEAVPADLRPEYERLRQRLGGVAVARVVANRCDGCHLSLSAVDLDRIRHLPEGQVFNCEQCSRILVP